MAVSASLYYDTSMISIDLYPDERREWVSDLPDDRAWPFDFDWDARKLEHGEYELGSIRVGDVDLITDYWLRELDKLDFPHIDIPEAGLDNVSVSTALRWVRETFSSRLASAPS